MEKVVYLLGAGFSAPLGLPTMSNFYIKSKDMYSLNPEKYKHFNEIFKTINQMSAIMNYFESDLFNIEEILSILEMQDQLSRKNRSDKFRKYIADVIEYYTPKLKPHEEGRLPNNWHTFIFGDNKWLKYGAFVASLLNIQMQRDETSKLINWQRNKQPNVQYSIVTLNYDLIIESVIEFLHACDYFSSEEQVKVTSDKIAGKITLESLAIAKLHGSVKPLTVIPPTWNKSSEKKMLSSWSLARRLIEEANYIRILGYSLPASDSYVKYLLKASVLESKHLKKIDVICRDTVGSVRKRYDDLIKFNYYRFCNTDISDYLEGNLVPLKQPVFSSRSDLDFNKLESIHEEYMELNRV